MAYGVGWTIVTFSLYVVAAASDEEALKAVTNPGWYCWLILCALSGFGLLLTFLAGHRGASVPLYFRIVLMAGATCGVFTFSSAWQAITASKAHATPAPQGAHLDLRDQVVPTPNATCAIRTSVVRRSTASTSAERISPNRICARRASARWTSREPISAGSICAAPTCAGPSASVRSPSGHTSSTTTGPG